MMRFLTFFLLTILVVFAIYQSHTLFAYIYLNYCQGLAVGSPVCMFVLDSMRQTAQAVYSFWIYACTIISGIFLYTFNRLFSELSGIQKKMEITEAQIQNFRGAPANFHFHGFPNPVNSPVN